MLLPRSVYSIVQALVCSCFDENEKGAIFSIPDFRRQPYFRESLQEILKGLRCLCLGYNILLLAATS